MGKVEEGVRREGVKKGIYIHAGTRAQKKIYNEIFFGIFGQLAGI